MEWTDDAVAKLMKLRKAGMTASEIAKRLGRRVTRNMVIGKLNRIGMIGKDKDLSKERKGYHKKRRAKRPAPRARGLKRKRKLNASKSMPLCCTEAVMALEPHSCRWPVGDQHEFEFCMAQIARNCNYPYCTEHVKIAIQDK